VNRGNTRVGATEEAFLAGDDARFGSRAMTNRTLEMSPQTLARIGGVIYLIIIVSGIFGELFVRDALIVSGDAATTASHAPPAACSRRPGRA